MESNKKQLSQERSELNALINNGYIFEIEEVTVVKKRGLFKKRVTERTKRQFKIEEPTLSTIDRLSSEWIEIAIDEEALKGVDGMEKARTLANKHAIRCAKIVALAVLGSDDYQPKEVKRLTELFSRTIKPSKLIQLALAINAMCNMGDFMNSIRLMCANRSTMPIRIEDNNED